MPNFPSINTLPQKLHLTGNEVIQISASEKTTLRAILDQLGFNVNNPITGFSSDSDPGFIVPTASDSLIVALSKLLARSGSNELFIMPLSNTMSYGDIDIMVLNTNTGTSNNYIGKISFSKDRGKISITVAPVPISQSLIGKTVQELNTLLSSNQDRVVLDYNMDTEKVSSSSSITGLKPGDIVYSTHTGEIISSISLSRDWYSEGYSSPVMYSKYAHYTATIVSKALITKESFEPSNNITLLFTEDFDDVLDTDVQCVTLQRIRYSTGHSWILVNKCGYSE